MNCVFDKLNIKHKFLINLDRRPERLQHATEQFAKIGLTGVQRISAVDAKQLGLTSDIKGILPGMIGCYQSHRNILKKCLDENIDSYIVFEDDVEFVDGFNTIVSWMLHELPADWEFIYWGYTEHHGFGSHLEQVNQYWVKPRSVWGTQCFMVRNRKTIQKLYDATEKMEMQIDEQLTHRILTPLGIKHYCCFPSVVGQLYEIGTDVQDRFQKI